MTIQLEDRLLMERLNRLEAKLKEDMRELEFLKTTYVIREWKRRSKT
jgi:hypothetical protein